jgi:hypothetical protein
LAINTDPRYHSGDEVGLGTARRAGVWQGQAWQGFAAATARERNIGQASFLVPVLRKQPLFHAFRA